MDGRPTLPRSEVLRHPSRPRGLDVNARPFSRLPLHMVERIEELGALFPIGRGDHQKSADGPPPTVIASPMAVASLAGSEEVVVNFGHPLLAVLVGRTGLPFVRRVSKGKVLIG